MTSMTADGIAGYEMALDAAKQLRSVAPDHELLRLVTSGDDEVSRRRDQERIERFWPAEHGDPDIAPLAKLDGITFGLLAKAMDRARADLPSSESLKFLINRVSIALDPPLDVFEAKLTRTGDWDRKSSHTFGSEPELRSFLQGVQAGVRCMGGLVCIPSIPTHPRKRTRTFESIEPLEPFDEDVPF